MDRNEICFSNYYVMKNPCRNCNNRHFRCHGSCQKYLEFKEFFESKKEIIYTNKKLDAPLYRRKKKLLMKAEYVKGYAM